MGSNFHETFASPFNKAVGFSGVPSTMQSNMKSEAKGGPNNNSEFLFNPTTEKKNSNYLNPSESKSAFEKENEASDEFRRRYHPVRDRSPNSPLRKTMDKK